MTNLLHINDKFVRVQINFRKFQHHPQRALQIVWENREFFVWFDIDVPLCALLCINCELEILLLYLPFFCMTVSVRLLIFFVTYIQGSLLKAIKPPLLINCKNKTYIM
jgi:hypothetical protein